VPEFILRAGAKQQPQAPNLVAVPLLPIAAAADGHSGSHVSDLNLVEPDAMLGAPRPWCPHPAYTSSLRVQGGSMEPVLHNGYIIVVDAYEKDRKKLRGDIVLAFSPDYGLFVSRLIWIKPAYILVPDNKKYSRIPLSPDCRIVGKVRWWIGLAQNSAPVYEQTVPATKPDKRNGRVRR
jgi:hypothetical protein